MLENNEISIQVFVETTDINKLTQVLWFIMRSPWTDVHDNIDFTKSSTLQKPLGPEFFGRQIIYCTEKLTKMARLVTQTALTI